CTLELYPLSLHDALPIWSNSDATAFTMSARVTRGPRKPFTPWIPRGPAGPRRPFTPWIPRGPVGPGGPVSPRRSLFAITPLSSRSEEHTSELQSRGHLVC